MTPEKARKVLWKMQATVIQADKIMGMKWLPSDVRYRAAVVRDHAEQIETFITERFPENKPDLPTA